jgi:predicted permease
VFPRARTRSRIDALEVVRVGALIEVEQTGDRAAFRANPFTVVARLQPGVGREHAEQVLRASLGGSRAVTISVHDLTAHLRSGLEAIALGALSAGLLILLACAGNVGNLLLARSSYRAREFATRLAIGGRRIDLIRLVAIELGMLSFVAVIIGLGLAEAAIALVAQVLPEQYSALGAPAVTGRVVGFALMLGTGIVGLGLIPCVIAWLSAARALDGHTSLSDSRRVRIARAALTAAQSAVALVLLSGAVLLGRSYVNLVSQDTGFAAGVRVLSVSYPSGHVGPRLQADIDGTLERLRRVPGVASVAAATGPMVDGLRSATVARVAGEAALVSRNYVTSGYFDTAGTRVVAGRAQAEDDGPGAVVVNQALARRYFPDGAVSRAIVLGGRSVVVVGVVADAFDNALDQPPGPAVYSLLQDVPIAWRVNYLVRAAGRAPDAPMTREIISVNSDAVVEDASPIAARLADTVRERTFAWLVLTFFAIGSLQVTVAGLAGIVSFVVARRTREIALRIALGATPARIRWVVLREVAVAVASGSLAGALAGHWLSRSLEHLAYGVEAGDWTSVAAAAVLTLAIAGVASAIPTRRAVRLDPSIALRMD